MISGLGVIFHLPGLTPTADSLPNLPGVDPAVSTAAAEKPFYKDPVTYAVAGGAVLAAIGGAMLLKKRRRK